MAPENAELEASSISEQKDHADCNARKRKSASRGKTKETQIPANASPKQDAMAGAENEESNAKRSKSEELGAEEKAKASESCRNSKGNQKQNPEPQKDYIHVRARRGEATDSHSLAERVRREKISERMKLLQDLVPGCNKVTGKAVMLDEIINYVQSLQRQVEFLSMKLATLNPGGELDVDDLLSKDALRAQLRRSVYQLDSSVYGLQCQQQFSVNPPTASMNGFGEGAPPQASAYWQDDLQSVVQMRAAQNQVPRSFHGSGSAGQMKVEL